MKELESNLFEERIKTIKGASSLLPERKPNGELDIEKFGLTLKSLICEQDKELADILNISINRQTIPVVAFALSTDDFKEVLCAMKYIEMSYRKEGFPSSATWNSRIRESLIQQAAHIVNIET